MILHLYFARRFAIALAAIAAVLVALVLLVDLVDQARRFSDFDLGFRKTLQLALLNAPKTVNLILPLIVILATTWLFVAFARSNELVVTRASGRSALKALIAPLAVAFLLGALAVAMINPIVAATSKRYAVLSENYRSGGVSALSISDEGLWLRQGGRDGQTVIRAWRSNTDASILFDVTFISYAPDGGPIRRIEAKSAALKDGEWKLAHAKSWPLGPGINAEAQAEKHSVLTVPSTLTLDRIRESFGSPSAVSIYDLPEFIGNLEQAGFSARKHRVWLQSELARPLFLMAMVLVASAFTMRHTRSGGVGLAVLISVLLGFGLYFIRSFAQILGENGQIPVLLAAWAPPMAAMLLGLGLLLHAEDG